ncbi:MAG: toll/interleukin-1 receptor domain-containing protein, partial [Acidimicrobiia bacterium]
ASDVARRLLEAGFTVFIDDLLGAGDALIPAIDDGVARATVVLLLWSASAAESPYVQGELLAARERGSLVPALLDETPVSTFFRSLIFRRLVVDGAWDERAFHRLRSDIERRCHSRGPGTRVANGLAGQTRSSSGRIGRAQSPESIHLSTGRRVRTSLRPRPPRSAAVSRAIAALSELQTGDRVSRSLRTSASMAAGVPSGSLVAVADLSSSALDRTFLCVTDSDVRFVANGAVSVVEVAALEFGEVKLDKEGYGLSSTISVGDVALHVRGSVATNLVLEVLFAIQEELAWG